MRTKCVQSDRIGISLVELLCATAVLLLVASVMVVHANVRGEANQARCRWNLKETSLAFRQFASDNGDRFPMRVSQRLGGAREAAAAGDVVGIIKSVADYLTVPEHVICPGDNRSAAATVPQVTIAELSYFVNATADRQHPGAVLLGDRDMVAADANRHAGNWLKGVQEVTRATKELTWSGVLHRDGGNVAQVDGAVVQLKEGELPQALLAGDPARARLLFPQ
jgi:hypothetical protein